MVGASRQVAAVMRAQVALSSAFWQCVCVCASSPVLGVVQPGFRRSSSLSSPLDACPVRWS